MTAEEPRTQRRARRIAMSDAERDVGLTKQRTCYLATTGASGPHVTPVWFVWDGGSLWINSLVRSQRWTDLARDPRVPAVVDEGVKYGELRGIELRGRVEVVGEVPRAGEPEPRLESVERTFCEKYWGQSEGERDGRHAWLELRPEKVVSWDFRKLGDNPESAEWIAWARGSP
jgi:Pyridoxamine 5'-phosphate oxidase